MSTFGFSFRRAVLILWLINPIPALAEPDLLLAKTYSEGVELSDYWVSEKLDGVRAYWNGEQLISRGGNKIQAPDWFLRGFPVEPMDGELWMGRGRFADVSAAARRQHPNADEWRQIKLMVFDLPADKRIFDRRLESMRKLIQDANSPYLAMIEQYRLGNHRALMEELDRVLAKGAEGLMLHRGSSFYVSGRSDDLLKVKRYEDAEALVLAHLPGQGKYRGHMGALLVRTPDGREFKLGSGFSDLERAKPPPLGAWVTYKFYGLTSKGLPRFASFLRIRQLPGSSQGKSQPVASD